jgi:hypothetical protein
VEELVRINKTRHRAHNPDLTALSAGWRGPGDCSSGCGVAAGVVFRSVFGGGLDADAVGVDAAACAVEGA